MIARSTGFEKETGRRTAARTKYPAAPNCSTSGLPMKPDAPVTRTVFFATWYPCDFSARGIVQLAFHQIQEPRFAVVRKTRKSAP
jgi:hypothetical protein